MTGNLIVFLRVENQYAVGMFVLVVCGAGRWSVAGSLQEKIGRVIGGRAESAQAAQIPPIF